jgi:predicted DNA-binding transcriptional regulator AlpA
MLRWATSRQVAAQRNRQQGLHPGQVTESEKVTTVMSTNTTPIVLNKTEVCARLSLSPRTLEGMVHDGEFPPGRRVGKFADRTEAAIERWVVRHFGPQECRPHAHAAVIRCTPQGRQHPFGGRVSFATNRDSTPSRAVTCHGFLSCLPERCQKPRIKRKTATTFAAAVCLSA